MQDINTKQQVETASLKKSRKKIVVIIILLLLSFVGIIALVAMILFPFVRILSGAAQTAISPKSAVIEEAINVSNNREYISPSIAFDYSFASAAISWDQDNDNGDAAMFLRSSNDGKIWSDWYETILFYKNSRTRYGEILFFPASSRYVQIKAVADEHDPQEITIQKININIFPEIKTPLAEKIIKSIANKFKVIQALAQTAATDIKIISRAEWSANEDWRFCASWDSAKNTCGTKSPDPKWPPQIHPVKKFVIHHTAGSNTANADPKELIRNIYLWHAIVIEGGWGDIGYNYIIDQQGNIYEGRFGGDGAQAGHTFNGPYCKRIGTAGLDATPCGVTKGDVEIGYQMNAGTVGIAVLGNFNTEIANEKVKAAIAKLINLKSQTAQINLNDTADWSVPIKVKSPDGMEPGIVESAVRDSGMLLTGKNLSFDFDFTDPINPLAVVHGLPTIISHRDVDRTSCPGDNFYPQLEEIRRLAINPTTEYEAKFESSTLPAAMYVSKADSGEIKIRNTGSRSWLKADVDLRIFDNGRKPSLFKDGPWNDPAGRFFFEQTEVKPQELATFKVPLMAPQYAGMYKHEFALFKTADNSEIFGSAFDREMRVDETHQGEFISSSLRAAVKTVWRPTMKLTFKNTGFATWSKNTVLEIYDPSGAPGAFKTKTQSGYTAAKLGATVKSGENAIFTTKLTPPKNPGIYKQIFKLKDGNKEIWLGRPEVSIMTRVDK